jgi:hypothetical protein
VERRGRSRRGLWGMTHRRSVRRIRLRDRRVRADELAECLEAAWRVNACWSCSDLFVSPMLLLYCCLRLQDLPYKSYNSSA